MGLWTFGALLIVTVNTIVWHGSIENRYPIWGDIATAWLAVYSFAVSCCAFCIQYRLWSIARTRRVFFTHKEKKRQNYVTYFICYGAPLIFKVVHYVNQGHRYDLYEDLGPHQTNYNTPVALATYFVFDQIVCIIATIFSFMTVICILKHRKEFNAVISSSVKINRSRYFQLLSLAAVTVSIHLPFTLWMYVNDIVGYPIHPWISWEDTHSNWMRIAYITRFMLSISPGEKVALSISYWTLPLCGILYFLLFGFGEEAMMQYNAVFDAIRRPFGALFRKVHLQHVNLRRTWLDVLLSRPGTSIDPTAVPMTKVNIVSDPTQPRLLTGEKETSNGTATSSRPNHKQRYRQHATQTYGGSASDIINDTGGYIQYRLPESERGQEAGSSGCIPTICFGSSISSFPGTEQQATSSPKSLLRPSEEEKKVEKDIPSDVETSSSSSRCSCTSCNAELVEEDSEDITETQRYSIEGKRAEKASITGRGVDGKPVANLVAEERDLEVGVAEPSQEPSPGELHRLEHLRHWPDATEEITF
ncbi:Pheromone B alpha 3 receptor [Serendipita indica DSM 11827]|nr:Pheromone B alpha 3 receptor [Serendipita indica DSM 11827]